MYEGTYTYFREEHPECVGFSPAVAKYLNMIPIKRYHAKIHSSLERLKDYATWRREDIKREFTANEAKKAAMKTKTPEEIERAIAKSKRIQEIRKNGTKEEIQRLDAELMEERMKDSVERNERVMKKELELKEAEKKFNISESQRLLIESNISRNVPWLSEYRIEELVDSLFVNISDHIRPSTSYVNPMYILSTLWLHHELLYLLAKATKNRDKSGNDIDSFFLRVKPEMMEKSKQLYSVYKCGRAIDSENRKICPANICEVVPTIVPGGNVCVAKECKENDDAYKSFDKSIDKFQKLIKECLVESLAEGIVPLYLFGVVMTTYWQFILPLIFEGSSEDYIDKYIRFFVNDPQFGLPVYADEVSETRYRKQFLEAEEQMLIERVNDKFPVHNQANVHFPDIRDGYANCMECVINNICHILLVNEKGEFSEFEKRIHRIHHGLKKYYEFLNDRVEDGATMQDISMNQTLSDMFADLVSDIPGVAYHLNTRVKKREVMARIESVFTILSYLFDVKIDNVQDMSLLSYGEQTVSAELNKDATQKIFTLRCETPTGKNLEEKFVIDLDVHGQIDRLIDGEGEEWTNDPFQRMCRYLKGDADTHQETSGEMLKETAKYSKFLMGSLETVDHFNLNDYKQNLLYPLLEVDDEIFHLGTYYLRNTVKTLMIYWKELTLAKDIESYKNVETLFIKFKIDKNDTRSFSLPGMKKAKSVTYENLPMNFTGLWSLPKCEELDIQGNILKLTDPKISKFPLKTLKIRCNVLELTDEFNECTFDLLKIQTSFVNSFNFSRAKNIKGIVITTGGNLEGCFNIPYANTVTLACTPSAYKIPPMSELHFENVTDLNLNNVEIPVNTKFYCPLVKNLKFYSCDFSITKEFTSGFPSLKEFTTEFGKINSVDSTFVDMNSIITIKFIKTPSSFEEFPRNTKNFLCSEAIPRNSKGLFPMNNLEKIEITDANLLELDENFASCKDLSLQSCVNFNLNETVKWLKNINSLHFFRCTGIQKFPPEMEELVTLKSFKCEYVGYRKKAGYPIHKINLSKLVNLEYLSVETNFAVEYDGIWKCPLVKVSFINNIYQELPMGIEDCPLEELTVISNAFNDANIEISEEVIKMETLRKLTLQGEGIVEIADVFDESSIEILILEVLYKIMEFPNSILRMPQLKKITVAGNGFEATPELKALGESLPGSFIEGTFDEDQDGRMYDD